MIQCRECGHEELAGTMFCSMCGASLIELEGKQAVVEDAPEPEPPSLLGQSTKVEDVWSEIIFVIPSGGRKLTFELGKDISIGRLDNESPQQSVVNLDKDGGGELGVSRTHAMIKTSGQEDGVTIIDLNSTNGTYLNQYRLPPELPYPVKNGDEIQFGNLLVHVFLR